MAPVSKASVSIACYSSQDPVHRAENILERGKRWLSNKDDKSGKIEAEIHFSKAIRIGFINIGNAGSAFIELLVGSSMWSHGKGYVTLLPSTMLMSPTDSKTGKKNEGVKMFDKAAFAKGVPDKEWDRLRVVCRQPFTRNKQFGLVFVDVIADDADADHVATNPESEREKTQRQSFAEFRRTIIDGKLQASKPGCKKQEPCLNPSLANLTTPLSSRAAGLVQAALKGQGASKPAEKHHQRLIAKPKRNLPYPVDAQLQRKRSMSRRTAGDIEDEVECFLETFNFEALPLESITYRNLKEQLEENRGCELSKAEGKTFLRLAKKVVLVVIEKREAAQAAESVANIGEQSKKQDEDDELEASIMNNTSCVQLSPLKSSKTSPLSQSRAVTSRSRPALSKSHVLSPLSHVTTSKSRAPSSGSCTLSSVSGVQPSKPRKQVSESGAQPSESGAPSSPQRVPAILEECPICEKFFPRAMIEVHASICSGPAREVTVFTSHSRDDDLEQFSLVKPACRDGLGSSVGSSESLPVKCPVCHGWFAASRINVHANVCAEACLLTACK